MMRGNALYSSRTVQAQQIVNSIRSKKEYFAEPPRLLRSHPSFGNAQAREGGELTVAMKVKDVMTESELKSCSPETKLAHEAKIMKENNRGALPVVDKDQSVVGIITDRDICLSVAQQNGKAAGELTVKEVLPKAKICTVNTDDEVADALRQMRKRKVSRLPVVDKTGKLRGILSINNILSRAIKKNEAIGQLKSKDENLAKNDQSFV